MGNLCNSICNKENTDLTKETTKGATAVVDANPETSNPQSNQLNDTKQPNQNAVGSINNSHQSNKLKSTKSSRVSSADFDFLKYLGKGAFGKVALVKKKSNGKFYAMKILKKKDFFMNDKSEENVITEKTVLMKSSHPFVVKLHYSFQDKTSVYYCLDYVEGGELFKYLKKKKRFTLWEAKFYAAQVLLALDHLHTDLDTIYRDLKPENILVDQEGYIKLTDFGLSKSSHIRVII